MMSTKSARQHVQLGSTPLSFWWSPHKPLPLFANLSRTNKQLHGKCPNLWKFKLSQVESSCLLMWFHDLLSPFEHLFQPLPFFFNLAPRSVATWPWSSWSVAAGDVESWGFHDLMLYCHTNMYTYYTNIYTMPYCRSASHCKSRTRRTEIRGSKLAIVLSIVALYPTLILKSSWWSLMVVLFECLGAKHS